MFSENIEKVLNHSIDSQGFREENLTMEVIQLRYFLLTFDCLKFRKIIKDQSYRIVFHRFPTLRKITKLNQMKLPQKSNKEHKHQ